MAQLGFFIDATTCSGCKTCQIACKDVNDLSVGALFRHVLDFEGGVFPYVWAASLSLSCNHCSNPHCVPNCPVAALSKDPETGLVLQDQSMCIGCERCVSLCPYQAPAYLSEQKVVGKCSGCLPMITVGKDPACVAACNMRALHFGELEELRVRFCDDTSSVVSGVKGIASPELTQPSLLIRAKKEML